MQTFYTALQILAWIVGALIVLGGAGGVVWFAATNRVRGEKHKKIADQLAADDLRLHPYKEAAEGYKLQVDQLERDIIRLRADLKTALDERDGLRARVRELEELTVNQVATLMRQQADLDRVKRQVEDLGDLRGQLSDVLTQIKNPTGR